MEEERMTMMVSRKASVVLFVPLVALSWWLGYPQQTVLYAIGLLVMVALTHFLRTRQPAPSEVESAHRQRPGR